SLTGAGATFPSLVYEAWFYDYHRLVAPGVKINYQAIGSGGGIEQFIAGDVGDRATDAPMSDKDLARAKDAQHLPTVLGGVVLAYDRPGLGGELRLDDATAARIFLGGITRWDEPAIAALNPGLALPA